MTVSPPPLPPSSALVFKIYFNEKISSPSSNKDDLHFLIENGSGIRTCSGPQG